MIQEILLLPLVQLGTVLEKCDSTCFFLFLPFSKLMSVISVENGMLGMPEWAYLMRGEKDQAADTSEKNTLAV